MGSNIKELAKATTIIRQMVTNSGDIPELTNAWFHKSCLKGHTGMEWVSVPLSNNYGLECGVNAAKLEKLLKNVDDDDVDLFEEDGSVHVEIGTTRTSIKSYPDSACESLFDDDNEKPVVIAEGQNEHDSLFADIKNINKSVTMSGVSSDQRCWAGTIDNELCLILTNNIVISLYLPYSWYFENPVSLEDTSRLANAVQEIPFSFLRSLSNVINKSDAEYYCIGIDNDNSSLQVSLSCNEQFDCPITLGCKFLDSAQPSGMSKSLFDNLQNETLVPVPKELKTVLGRVKSFAEGSGPSSVVSLTIRDNTLTLSATDNDNVHEESIALDYEHDDLKGTIVADALTKSLDWAEQWSFNRGSILLTNGGTISLVHFARED